MEKVTIHEKHSDKIEELKFMQNKTAADVQIELLQKQNEEIAMKLKVTMKDNRRLDKKWRKCANTLEDLAKITRLETYPQVEEMVSQIS